MKNIQTNNSLLKAIAGLSMYSAIFSNTDAQVQSDQPARPMNVLFIAVDDLRPILGCYGDQNVISPNIDRIANQGMVFNRAYCQVAWCNPSRASLMTGTRPDKIKVYDLNTHFRTAVPTAVTLPEQFKKYGYYTLSFGKIYHHTGQYGKDMEDPQSWSEPAWVSEKPLFPASDKNSKRLPYQAPDVADNELNDGHTTDMAIEALQRIKDKSFFLAVGFMKPHLPLVAPKKYWDLYNREQFKLADNPYLPEGVPTYALGIGDKVGCILKSYYSSDKTEEGCVPDDEAISVIHGYNACVSYVDAQIGRIVSELEKLKLKDNTIIIIWGDHGWHLGEHGHWGKNTNYEVSVRSPLIISVPGQSSKGKSSDALVEFVDVYPSLCNLCGIPIPDGLEGSSFTPLLKKPGMDWKKAAFSQHPRYIPDYGKGMGYSIKTDRYRLTEWTSQGTSLLEYELYDHKKDPQENKNLAGLPEYKNLVEQLATQLHSGWKDALPKRN